MLVDLFYFTITQHRILLQCVRISQHLAQLAGAAFSVYVQQRFLAHIYDEMKTRLSPEMEIVLFTES